MNISALDCSAVASGVDARNLGASRTAVQRNYIQVVRRADRAGRYTNAVDAVQVERGETDHSVGAARGAQVKMLHFNYTYFCSHGR